jgi:hypothetical protein
MRVIRGSELNVYIVVEVDFLLIISRIIYHGLPPNTTVSDIFPTLALSEIECEAYPINLIIVDTLIVVSPLSVVPTSCRVLRKVLFLPKRLDRILNKVYSRGLFEICQFY